MWSPIEQTALAEAEVEYHDKESFTVWVKFKVAEADFSRTAEETTWLSKVAMLRRRSRHMSRQVKT